MADAISINRSGENFSFETVEAGVAALESGDVLTLLDDVTLSNTIVLSDVEATLDLAGHLISCNKGNSAFYLGSGAVLVVKDSSENSSGTIKHTSQSGVYLSNQSTDPNPIFTLESGIIEAQEFGICIFGGAIVNINGGVVISHDNGAVGANGSKKYATYPYEINITGGKLIAETQSAGYANCAVYAANAGVVNISGGEIEGVDGAGVVVRAGQVNISGGIIRGSGSTERLRMGDANPTFCGGIEICNSANYPGKMGTCTITGGEIISEYNSALLVIGDPNNSSTPNSSDSKVLVSGGVFEAYKSAIGYITKTGEEISEPDTANLSVLRGRFSSNVSQYLASGIELQEIVLSDGSVVYAVAKTISDVVDAINTVETKLDAVNDTLSANQELISSIKDDFNDSNTTLNNVKSTTTNIYQKMEILDDLKSNSESANTSLSDIKSGVDSVNQNITNANQKLDTISTTESQIKQDTSDIKSTASLISTKLDTVIDSLSKLVEINKKTLTEVGMLNGEDLSNEVDSGSARSEEAIQLIQIQTRVNQAKLNGESEIIWNHVMTETVETFCKNNGYSITKPSNLGGQYLILITSE